MPRAKEWGQELGSLGSRRNWPSPTWLPEDRQVGPAAGELCVGEHHDTILGSFVETKHSLLVIFHWKKPSRNVLGVSMQPSV